MPRLRRYAQAETQFRRTGAVHFLQRPSTRLLTPLIPVLGNRNPLRPFLKRKASLPRGLLLPKAKSRKDPVIRPPLHPRSENNWAGALGILSEGHMGAWVKRVVAKKTKTKVHRLAARPGYLPREAKQTGPGELSSEETRERARTVRGSSRRYRRRLWPGAESFLVRLPCRYLGFHPPASPRASGLRSRIPRKRERNTRNVFSRRLCGAKNSKVHNGRSLGRERSSKNVPSSVRVLEETLPASEAVAAGGRQRPVRLPLPPSRTSEGGTQNQSDRPPEEIARFVPNGLQRVEPNWGKNEGGRNENEG